MIDRLDTDATSGVLEATLESVASAVRYHAWLARTIRPHLRYPTLEIGAGFGTLSRAVAELGLHMLASEPDSVLRRGLRDATTDIEKIQVVSPVLLPVSDWPKMSPQPSTVLMSNVLEHIEDERSALASILTAAPTVDRLLLVVPAHRWAYTSLDERLGHFRRYSRSTVATVMREAGWDVTFTRYFNPIGALAWASGRFFGRASISPWQTKLVEALIPVLAGADRLLAGRTFGQSVIALGQRPSQTSS